MMENNSGQNQQLGVVPTNQPTRSSSAQLHGISIRWIICIAIIFTSLVVPTIGFWIIVNRNVGTLRKYLIDSMFITAQLTREKIMAGVASKDIKGIERAIEYLMIEKDISAVMVFDRDKHSIASYPKDFQNLHKLNTVNRDLVTLHEDHLDIILPMEKDGVKIGYLMLISSLDKVNAKTSEYIATVTIFCSGLLCLSLVIAILFHYIVSNPILELAKVAERLTQTEDYRVRIPTGGVREINILGRSLNRLIKALEKRREQHIAAEQTQKLYADRLRVLREIDRTILTGTSPQDVSMIALEALQNVMNFTVAEVMEFDEEHRYAKRIARVPKLSEDSIIPLETEGNFLDEIRWNVTWIAEDVRVAGDIPRLLSSCVSPDAPTLTCFPLIADGRLLGIFTLATSRILTKDEKEMAQEIAGLLALSLRQSRLMSEIQRHTEELEKRVAERTAQVEASNRELEAFGYSIAHDLRAPLRSIRKFSEALLEDYNDRLDNDGKDLLKRIVVAGERMDRLIVDLLEYSRITSQITELTTVDLSSVVWEVRAQLAAQLTERQVVIAVSEPLGRVFGHRVTLVQVVQNLISNAIKFVELNKRPVVKIWSEDKGDTIRLWVEDNGIGIEKENIGRIFGLFERLHTQKLFSGTGIGLAIAKKGIEKMGGQIGVESEYGRGSKFWFELRKATGEPSTEEIRIRDSLLGK